MRTTFIENSGGPRGDLIAGWTGLWNGDLGAASRVCASTITIRFGGVAVGTVGDKVTTPADLAALIEDFRSTRAGLTYRIVDARSTDEWGHCIWNASRGERHVGGIDTFAFGVDGITRVHSVTGERPMGA